MQFFFIYVIIIIDISNVPNVLRLPLLPFVEVLRNRCKLMKSPWTKDFSCPLDLIICGYRDSCIYRQG